MVMICPPGEALGEVRWPLPPTNAMRECRQTIKDIES